MASPYLVLDGSTLTVTYPSDVAPDGETASWVSIPPNQAQVISIGPLTATLVAMQQGGCIVQAMFPSNTVTVIPVQVSIDDSFNLTAVPSPPLINP